MNLGQKKEEIWVDYVTDGLLELEQGTLLVTEVMVVVGFGLQRAQHLLTCGHLRFIRNHK
jgi:hypothetical protein